ncbi:MAG: hypothetical protein ACPIOQ_32640, partial [Promethearchaeia archaeon]
MLELRSVPVLVGCDMVWLGRGVISALRMPTRLLSMMATTPDDVTTLRSLWMVAQVGSSKRPWPRPWRLLAWCS